MADLRTIKQIGYGKAKAHRLSAEDPEVRERLCGRYIALDTETTGLDPEENRVLEIGAVLYENGEEKAAFHGFVNAGVSILPEITAINGISEETIRNAPDEKIVLEGLLDFLGDGVQGGTILCGHVTAFDLSFLCCMMERCGLAGDFAFVDTRELALQIPDLESHGLAAAAQYFGIPHENAHQAVEDARVTGQILWKILQRCLKT